MITRHHYETETNLNEICKKGADAFYKKKITKNFTFKLSYFAKSLVKCTIPWAKMSWYQRQCYACILSILWHMMTSSNGNIFCVTDPFVWGIYQWLVNSQHKSKWCGALMFSLICASINGWVNNRRHGDLRRQLAHYDVTIMRHGHKVCKFELSKICFLKSNWHHSHQNSTLGSTLKICVFRYSSQRINETHRKLN